MSLEILMSRETRDRKFERLIQLRRASPRCRLTYRTCQVDYWKIH